jgi:hypothetical protein
MGLCEGHECFLVFTSSQVVECIAQDLVARYDVLV